MLRWAVTVRSQSARRLLEHSTLAGIRRPRERNPKRPVATWERYQATSMYIQYLAVNAKSDRAWRKWLRLVLGLTLSDATGRRLGAIRQLKWEDINLIHSTIRWLADTDKKVKEWVIPIPTSLCEE